MARYPGARWRPVTRYLEGGSSCQAMVRYDAGIDHTYVGSPSPDAAFAHFNVPGTPTPHFMVFRDGTIDQYIDTRFRSSACLDGNPRLITWETADGYPNLWVNGSAPKDTPAMVQAKARLMVWLHNVHGIPLDRMPSSRSTARGFGWHRLGIDGNFEEPAGQLLGGRVSGGEHWSTSFGKTCPTSTRIHQFVEETLPAAVKLGKPKPPPKRPTIKVVHQSGKWTVGPAVLTAALDDLVANHHPDVITLTEVSPPKFRIPLLRWALANGYWIHHPAGAGADECAILTRHKLLKGKARQLTSLRLKFGRKAPTFLVSAKIDKWGWFSVLHTPAHTNNLQPGLWPTRVYKSILDTLERMRMQTFGKWTLLLDANRDLRRPDVRADWHKSFPRLRLLNPVDQHPTCGNRVIDGGGTTLRIKAKFRTLPGHKAADHNPVKALDHKPVICILEGK